MKFNKLLLPLVALAAALPIHYTLLSRSPETSTVSSHTHSVVRDWIVDAKNHLHDALATTPVTSLSKRTNPLPNGMVVCNESWDRFRWYSRQDIQRAVDEGHRRRVAGEMTTGWRSGARGYPHRYYDDNTFVSSVNAGEADTSIFYEYPILPDATYTEGRPGLDRVIFDRNGNFITIIAHETRQNANDFRVGFEAGPNDWNQIELQNTNGIGSWQRWLSNHAARGGLQFVIGYAFADKAVQFWPRGN